MKKVDVDLVTLTTVWHGLQRVCHEMRHVIDRTAGSYLIAQLHDVSVGVWDATGRTVAIPVGLAVQFAGSKFPVQFILEKFKGNIFPGDVFLANDPYHGGFNCHVPDWCFFRPIFYKDELLFFTLAKAHQMDSGGAFPGGYFPAPYDVHAEGLCIPPTKVFEKGVEKTDLFELIWNNVRWPEAVRVDNYAMIAATKICEKRIVELLDRYGRDTVTACVDAMIQRTERTVRSEISKIPDGTYYGEAATDDDSAELDVPVWARCDVTKKGDELTIDFSKSDSQRKGFVNNVYASTYSQAVVASLLFLDPAIADFHNEGSMEPIHVVAPEGSVLNCRYPAPVGGSPVSMGIQIMEAVLMAMSQALPQRAIASWGHHRGDYVFGTDPRTDERYVRTSFDYDGSGGACYGHDGYQGATALGGLGSIQGGNVEEEEMRIPLRILKYQFATDLMGAGKWRGGPGMHWEAINEGSDSGMATGSSDGETVSAPGALGGQPTPFSSTWIKRGEEMIFARCHRMHQVKTGDIIVKHSSGGAGVGDPAERDPEKVKEDVINELVSLKAARETYKVAIDPITMEIHWQETKALRSGVASPGA